jgi:hypothetical protein
LALRGNRGATFKPERSEAPQEHPHIRDPVRGLVLGGVDEGQDKGLSYRAPKSLLSKAFGVYAEVIFVYTCPTNSGKPSQASKITITRAYFWCFRVYTERANWRL